MENNKSLFLVIIFSLSVVMGFLILFRGGEPGNINIFIKKKQPGFSEKNIYIINIYGVISFSDSTNIIKSHYSYDKIVKKLRKISYDPKISGVVLRINSPGGTIGASQEVYEEILRLRKMGKKVYASFGDIATSGGYYIASGCDKIYSNPGTITGSIGVLYELSNLSELIKKVGIKFDVIKSGKYKDIGNIFRDLTTDEKKLLQEIIDLSYQQFVQAVSTGRNIPVEKVMEIADGRILIGTQAKELKLVDEMGNSQDALEDIWKQVGGQGIPKVAKEEISLDNIFSFFIDVLRQDKFDMINLYLNKWIY